MKRILAALLLTAMPLLAQDRLERPVVASATGATINVAFTLGSLGFVQDVTVKSDISGINTAVVYAVDSNIGHTNTIATWVFTNHCLNRISSTWPVQQGDIVRTVFTGSSTGTNNTTEVWFKNVTH